MEKNTAIVNCDPVYKKNGLKAWSGEASESRTALTLISYHPDLNSILETDNFSPGLKEHIKSWSLSYLACSALWFHFKNMPLYNNHVLSVSAWSTFTTIFMNVETSETIILFL